MKQHSVINMQHRPYPVCTECKSYLSGSVWHHMAQAGVLATTVIGEDCDEAQKIIQELKARRWLNK